MSFGAVAASVAGAAVSSELSDGGSPQRSISKSKLPAFLRQPTMDLLSDGTASFDNADYIGLDPAQERGLRLAELRASRMLPATRNLQPVETLNTAGDTLRATAAGEFLDPSTNPAMGATIDAATGQVVDEFERSIMPELGSAAQRSGAFGGARQGLAEARAADEVTENIGDISNRMLSSFYNAERGRQQQALRMAPNFANAEQNMTLAPSNIFRNIGQVRRNAAQGEEVFDTRMAEGEAAFLNALNPGNTRTRTRRRRQPSSAVQALQGGMGGLQLYNSASKAFGGGSSEPISANAAGTGSNPLIAGGL